MGKHTSQPRNPKMAEAFYRAGFIEAWGRGIEKIVNGFKAEGLTPPTFSVEQGGVTVNILREKFVAINMGGTTDINQFKGPEMADQKPNQTDTKSNQKGDQKSDQKIIGILKENPNTTIHQLMDLLQMSESGIKKILRKLKLAGKIRRVGSDKGGSWKVIEQ